MPQKVKVTEEALLGAAVKIMREEGWSAINARRIAKELDCSTKPIFRVYSGMKEFKKAAFKKAGKIFYDTMIESMRGDQPILNLGLAYIDFARTETNLFKLFFMSYSIEAKSLMGMIEKNDDFGSIHTILKMTDLPMEMSKQMLINLWMVAHGIASIIATNPCAFSDEEIREILTDSFKGYLTVFKEKIKE